MSVYLSTVYLVFSVCLFLFINHYLLVCLFISVCLFLFVNPCLLILLLLFISVCLYLFVNPLLTSLFHFLTCYWLFVFRQPFCYVYHFPIYLFIFWLGDFLLLIINFSHSTSTINIGRVLKI